MKWSMKNTINHFFFFVFLSSRQFRQDSLILILNESDEHVVKPFKNISCYRTKQLSDLSVERTILNCFMYTLKDKGWNKSYTCISALSSPLLLLFSHFLLSTFSCWLRVLHANALLDFIFIENLIIENFFFTHKLT